MGNDIYMEFGDNLEISAGKVGLQVWGLKLQHEDETIYVYAPTLYCYTHKPRRYVEPTFMNWLRHRFGRKI